MTVPWQLNLDAYRLIADVLVTFRRIVARAVVKAHAQGDPRAVWPPAVLERLERRWREEVETERQPSAEDDVLSFATFADLAELVAGDSEVSALLTRLSPSSGELHDLLQELELVRRRVAVAHPLAEADLERLLELQGEFRAMLAGGSGGAGGSLGDRRREVRRSGDRDAPDRRVARDRRVDREVGRRPVEGAPVAAAADPAKPAPAGSPGGPPPAKGPLRPQAAAPPAPPRSKTPPPPAAPAGLTAASREAIDSGDDRRVLAELHREVMAMAEGIYAGAPELVAPVWREVQDRGWVDARRDDLALDPLLRFHALVDVLAGVELGTEPRRAALAEAGFASLLLELRQMFRRHLA